MSILKQDSAIDTQLSDHNIAIPNQTVFLSKEPSLRQLENLAYSTIPEHLYSGSLVNRIITQAEVNFQREILLNDGCDRPMVIDQVGVESLQLTEKLQQAFDMLRKGYPNLPISEQCQGKEFQRNADLIISAIIEKTLQHIDPKQAVVLMPWRSGLAFGQSYLKFKVNRFFHLSSKRDEDTLETVVDYQKGELSPRDTVIIADPMLATGNTAIDAIERVMSQGVKPGNIIVNAVVAAPIGIKNVTKYPGVRVVAGAIDEKLDHRGYIVPGLGDFGDKYFAGYTEALVHDMADDLNFDHISRKKLANRFNRHISSEEA